MLKIEDIEKLYDSPLENKEIGYLEEIDK